MNDLLGDLHHLTFGDPEGGLGDGHGKIVDLNAVKLSDGNAYRAVPPPPSIICP